MKNKSLLKCRVLVTPTSFGKYDPDLKSTLETEVGDVVYNTTGRPLPTNSLLNLISDVDGYIAGLDSITADVIKEAHQLKVIARYGVGADKIDLKAAAAKGIVVTNTPKANSSSVAELTVGLMIALARNIPEANMLTRSGKWPRLNGTLLSGKTIGLVGFGAIGSCVAKLLAGFDCLILAYDPYLHQEIANDLTVEFVELDLLLKKADFISLHCPLTEETTRLVEKDFLAGMKPGAFLVNTARGELINESALYDSLMAKHVRGAALDAFCEQPPKAENPLLSLSQVIVTPHTGAHTDGAAHAMGWGAMNNCLAVLRGKEPQNRVI